MVGWLFPSARATSVCPISSAHRSSIIAAGLFVSAMRHGMLVVRHRVKELFMPTLCDYQDRVTKRRFSKPFVIIRMRI